MKHNTIPGLAALTIASIACGGAHDDTTLTLSELDLAEPATEERPATTATGTPITYQSESVSRIEGEYGRIDFLTRPMLDEADPTPVISTTHVSPDRYHALINELAAEGATPLEIFRAFEPDLDPPQALLDNHASVVQLEGREASVREYSGIPPVYLNHNYDCHDPEFLQDAAPSGYRLKAVAHATNGVATPADLGFLRWKSDKKYGLVAQASCAYLTRVNPGCGGQSPVVARDIEFKQCKGGGCGIVTANIGRCDLFGHNNYSLASGYEYTVSSRTVTGVGGGINVIVTRD